MHGGAADRSGLIHVGDEVLEVNNFNVVGKTPADVHKILVSEREREREMEMIIFCNSLTIVICCLDGHKKVLQGPKWGVILYGVYCMGLCLWCWGESLV